MIVQQIAPHLCSGDFLEGVAVNLFYPVKTDSEPIDDVSPMFFGGLRSEE